MDITVVSLNIWHSVLLDDVIAFLKQQQADVVMLQEVSNSSDSHRERRFRAYSVIQHETGYAHAAYAVAAHVNWPEGKAPDGNAVFSRFPLTAHTPIFFNEPFSESHDDTLENGPIFPRNLQHVEAETPAGIMHVFNFQGVYDLDGDNDSPKRRNMSRIILEQTKGLKNVVVAGDTNAKPTNPAMRTLETQLTSVFGNELPTSFNVRRKDLAKFPGYATAAVDLMYVSPDVQVIDHACLDVDLSDHLPLTATLRIG